MPARQRRSPRPNPRNGRRTRTQGRRAGARPGPRRGRRLRRLRPLRAARPHRAHTPHTPHTTGARPRLRTAPRRAAARPIQTHAASAPGATHRPTRPPHHNRAGGQEPPNSPARPQGGPTQLRRPKSPEARHTHTPGAGPRPRELLHRKGPHEPAPTAAHRPRAQRRRTRGVTSAA